jgi:hypothetical protein
MRAPRSRCLPPFSRNLRLFPGSCTHSVRNTPGLGAAKTGGSARSRRPHVDCADQGQPDAGGERPGGLRAVGARGRRRGRRGDVLRLPQQRRRRGRADRLLGRPLPRELLERGELGGGDPRRRAIRHGEGADTERGEFLGDYAGLASVGNAFTPLLRPGRHGHGRERHLLRQGRAVGHRPAPKPAPGRAQKPRAGYSSCCSRRTSAHGSTPTTSVLPCSLCADEPRLRKPPDDSPRRPHSNRRRWPSFARRRHYWLRRRAGTSGSAWHTLARDDA